MFNIGVSCDVLWDNFILINNKFKKINCENFKLHSIYGKSLEIINNCCSKNMLTNLRHQAENVSKIILNMLKICDLWIIFTNHIEYNTPVRLIIDKCKEFNIRYIIVSEYRRNNDFYSFEYSEKLSFKKILNSLTKSKNNIIEDFNEIIYNDNFSKKLAINLSINSIKQKLKESYENTNRQKKERSIQILYDKDELKKEKEMKKNIKTIKQLDFSKNRMNYYKSLK